MIVSTGSDRWTADLGSQVKGGCGNRCDAEFAGLDGATTGAYRIGGGYRLTPYFALELTYVDLGETSSRYRTVSAGITADVKGTYRLDGVQAAAIGRWPVTETAAVFGKVGALAARLRYSEKGTEAFNPSPRSFTAPTDRSTRAMFGLGAEYRLDSQWMLRGEWERNWSIGRRFGLSESENGRFDTIDALFLGVIYQF